MFCDPLIDKYYVGYSFWCQYRFIYQEIPKKKKHTHTCTWSGGKKLYRCIHIYSITNQYKYYMWRSSKWSGKNGQDSRFNKMCVGGSVGADGRALGHVCSVQVGVESQRGIQEPRGGKEALAEDP